MKIKYLTILLLICGIQVQAQKWVNTKHVVPDEAFDTLALTPPMGWNSWNCFQENINEDNIKQVADAMVASGMQKAGYQYIVLDDFWMIDRDEDGNILADPKKFPHGMKALADYIHSKGLKFGLYLDAGVNTCGGQVGSRGYEFQDALQLARWGVDFIKVDWCHHLDMDEASAYLRMHDAIKNSGRPMMLNICVWGKANPWLWGPGIGQSWRVHRDLVNCFDCINEWDGCGVVQVVDVMAPLAKYAGPGHWNDADMLQVGNKGLSLIESQSHFSMWCMLASPLFAGNDIRNMTPEVKEILTNKEAIAINQDVLGKQATRFMTSNGREIWIKPLSNKELAVCFFNRNEQEWDVEFDWTTLTSLEKNHKYSLRDVWQHKDIGTTEELFKANIPAHGAILLKLHNK